MAVGPSKLRLPDARTRYAAVLSIQASVPLLIAAGLLLRNYHPELGAFTYGDGGSFVLGFLACLALSTIPATIGLFLGWNSARQRRNGMSIRSWIGCLAGGLILTLDVILFLVFYMFKLKVVL